MITFLIYQVKVAVLLALLYLFYKVVFRHWTLHRLSRGYLLGSFLLSLLLPLCSITFHHTVPLSEVTQVSDLVPTTTAAMPLLEEIAHDQTPRWIWPAFLLYASGVLLMLIRLLRATLQVVRLIRSGERIDTEGRIKIILIDADIVSCSWMNHILLSREDYDAGRQEILAHERAHIALHHSLDLLLVDLFAALQWFNPFVRRLREELVAIHEYQADEAVLEHGADAKAYQMLILSKEAAARGLQIANSFSASLLKRRIRMMDRARTSGRKAWKMLYIIPLLGVALLANAHVTSQVSEVPLLLFDRESISLEELVSKQGEAGDAAFLSSREMARIFGGPVPGGIVSFNTVETAPRVEGGITGRFQLLPGFNVDDPDAYPLLIVNGVDFPYWRRKEFLTDYWQWKWFAFLHAGEAVPIYGEKARNGAFIVNVELSAQ
ncbi:MAG: M56 family metallopeptidase [Bacteroidales bacterium]|nr:M56 family metallopeptidase [Bacteroidales bacterium]